MRKRKATRSEIIERNGKIVKDYENGLSFEQLSEKYGLCVRTCYRALDEEQQAQRIAEEQDHANLVDKIVAEYTERTENGVPLSPVPVEQAADARRVPEKSLSKVSMM